MQKIFGEAMRSYAARVRYRTGLAASLKTGSGGKKRVLLKKRISKETPKILY